MAGKPTIQALDDGPFLIKGLTDLRRGNLESITLEKDVVALCRCGASNNKPFCDGSHVGEKFSGKKERKESYPVEQYEGKELTVVDDIGICSHAGECVRGAPEVFFRWENGKRISQPDDAEAEKVKKVVRRCPSGSLLTQVDGNLEDEHYAGQIPRVVVSKNGPLMVQGTMELEDPEGARPATNDHFTLCRCGASKNKPFCDGTHDKVGFVAD